MRVTLGLNATNLFDQKTATAFLDDPVPRRFNVADAVFFGGFDPAAVATAQNFRPDARFGMASGYPGSRASIRLQAKFSF